MAKRVFNNSKVTDHHAIIPTDESPILRDLSPDERKLYDIIVRRFLVLFYPAYRFEKIQVDLNINGESFVANELIILDHGFKDVTGKENGRSSIKKTIEHENRTNTHCP